MHAAELTHAAQRLRHAPWRSSVTEEALAWLAQSPSRTDLIDALDCARFAPAALEVLCALEPECEQAFRAVTQTIEHDAALCWALVESLNRLPWYGGIRAFLSLESPPESSPCVYPFYILARNKLFVPSNMPAQTYAYCYHGLWRLLPVARSEDWGSPAGSVIAIVELMHKHLEMPRPDPFVVYFAGLLLGRISPMNSDLEALHRRARGDGHPIVKSAARLAMEHIRLLHPGPDASSAPARLPVPVR